MGVQHAVITMVNRDDMPDGGAEHVAQTVLAVRERTGAAVEVLISDLEGNRDALRIVIASQPEVLAHNVETVPRLYSAVRPVAKYAALARHAPLGARRDAATACSRSRASCSASARTEEEILDVARDLREAGVDIFTMGQYLAPTEKNHPVRRYYTPEEFAELGQRAREPSASITSNPRRSCEARTWRIGPSGLNEVRSDQRATIRPDAARDIR